MAFNTTDNTLYVDLTDEAMPQHVSLSPVKRLTLVARAVARIKHATKHATKKAPKVEDVAFDYLGDHNIAQYLVALMKRREALLVDDEFELQRVTDEIDRLNADPQEFCKLYNVRVTSSRLASSESDSDSDIPYAYDIDSRVFIRSS